MAQLRIALAQINPTVGDLAGNTALVLESARAASAAGAHLLAAPELALTGYPIEDLALRSSFVQASRAALEGLTRRLADEGLGELVVVVGYLDATSESPARTGRPIGSPQNAAAVLHRGSVLIRSAKHHLPNYGVFDEYRYFAPGDVLPVVRVQGVDVAIAICEDLWQDGGPVAAAAVAGAGLLLSLNASPYELAKDDFRYELMRSRALEAGCTLAYVNQVGGQDELVFDGDSLIADAEGNLLARAPQFVEHLMTYDFDLPAGGYQRTGQVQGFDLRRVQISTAPVPSYPAQPAPPVAQPLPDLAEVWSALVTGLRDYVHKNGFRSVTFGFSGGIDSAVVAALAADALGADALYGVSMPSGYSTEHSRSDAAELARRIGCHFETQPIGEMVTVFVNQLGLSGLAEENVQARCRGVLLMARSNSFGHLVLATGNKTELAVGYSTIYGDAVGGFAPIKDVPKTLVWELAKWRNAEAERNGEVPPIPENSITKPPSAELRPDQFDTDSLPDYALLDAVLDSYIEGDLGYRDLLAAGFDPEVVEKVLRMVDGAEYKRRQYPPGTKITFRAFGRDRRLPITNGWREKAPITTG